MKDKFKIKEGERQDRVFLSKVKGVDTKNHTVDVVMSDASVDRYREVIHPNAWKNGLKNYKKHPVLLSSHNYHGLTNQIGKALKIKVNEQGELEAKMKYFVGKGNEEADWGFFLVEEGIAAYSVGFIPKSYVYSGDGDFEDLAKELGYSKKEAAKIRIIFTEVELLENSQVLVPANPAGLLKGFESEDVQGDEVLKSLYTDAIAKVDSFSDFFATEGAATISKSFEADLAEEEAESSTGEGRIKRKKLAGDVAGLEDTSADSIKAAKDIIAKIKGLSLSDTGIEDVIAREADPDLSKGDISEILKAIKALGGKELGEGLDSNEGNEEVDRKEKDATTTDTEDELEVEEEDTGEEEDLIEKSVVPFKSYGLLDEDTAWRASSAKKRLRNWAGGPNKEDVDFKKYRKGFTQFDENDADNFGAYKLPHHDVVDGEVKTVWRGVAAAMGVLLGARGGVDIPEDERRGVYNHLKRHYSEFEKDVPDFKAYKSVDDVLTDIKDSDTAIATIKSINGIEEVEKAPTLDDIEDAIELGLKKIESFISDAIAEFKSLTIKSDDGLAEKVDGFESELAALRSVVTDLGENALGIKDVEVAAKGQMSEILKGVEKMTARVGGKEAD
jgi:hypothetical protein